MLRWRSTVKFGPWRLLSLFVGCSLALAGCSPTAEQSPSAKTGGESGKNSTESSSTGVKRIIFVTNGNSPFFDVCRAGLQAAEKDLDLAKSNLRAVLDVNDGSAPGQLNKLRQYGIQGDVAGVAISVVDADNAAVAGELRNLQKKGVKIVCVDSDVNRDKFADARFAFIGTNNFEGGKELGICAKNLLPEGGEYVTFVGKVGAQNAKDRIGGFAKGAGEKFASVDNMGDDFDRSRARENVRNAIRNHPALKSVVGIYSYNAPAIVDVVKETNKRAALKVVTFDAEPIAIAQMADGQIDAMVVQNPFQMGYQSVRLLKALVADDQAVVKEMFPKKGEAGGDIYDTGLKVVVPEKSSLKKELFGSKTEFLSISDFQAWLKKYNLTSS